ncbi:22306_t:CDS:2 [Cetraspora pellucida]|uniref:22306_t:CDS:1 n=1 Tax=Cetraspora pellucida TaxID=1433469 RepID=A0A9N9B9T0_9GLOM|nr:22306_t:CDS:2 [Cetraspora pellucida]
MDKGSFSKLEFVAKMARVNYNKSIIFATSIESNKSTQESLYTRFTMTYKVDIEERVEMTFEDNSIRVHLSTLENPDKMSRVNNPRLLKV